MWAGCLVRMEAGDVGRSLGADGAGDVGRSLGADGGG